MKLPECAEAYLELAQLCRELADEVASPEARWDLEAVARQYERLVITPIPLPRASPAIPEISLALDHGRGAPGLK